MIKKIQWWQIELLMDVAAVTVAIVTGEWAFLALYFAVGYFGHKAATYLERN